MEPRSGGAARGMSLLQQQLEDLGTCHHLLDGQRAVLRMDDAHLLAGFLAEVDRLLSTIGVRQQRLASVHRSVQQADGASPKTANLQQLQRQVDSEVERLRTGVHRMTELLVGKQQALATQLESIARQERDDAYGPMPQPRPTMIDTIR